MNKTNTTTKKIEAGRYEAVDGSFLIEKIESRGWVLFVADTNDPDYEGAWSWSDDYETKKEALEAAAEKRTEVN